MTVAFWVVLSIFYAVLIVAGMVANGTGGDATILCLIAAATACILMEVRK